MIKVLCKECGGRHWSHEPHVNQPKRSAEQIMGVGHASKPAQSVPPPPQAAPAQSIPLRDSDETRGPEPLPMGLVDREGIAPQAGDAAMVAPAAIDEAAAPPAAALVIDPINPVAEAERLRIEQRKAYMRDYQRRLREKNRDG